MMLDKGMLAKRETWIRYTPDPRSLAAMLGSIILVVGTLSCATYVATPSRGVAYFLLYAVAGALAFGVALPLAYTAFARREGPEALGITARRLPSGLVLQVVFCAPLVPKLIVSARGVDPASLLPLVALALSIGFFEAVFWRGWVYGTLERSFGVVPALILGAALYAAYHVGYGMPASEMVFLFFVGLMFNAAFALSGNIFILWPFFQPSGQLVTVIKDGLNLPTLATIGFAEALVGMIALTVIAKRLAVKMRARG